MRDGLIIFTLCIVAIIIGGWLFFYAPSSIALFPHDNAPAAYAPSAPSQAAAAEIAFSEVASGTASKAVNQKNYLIAAKDAFAEVWAIVKQPPAPPAIDFSKNDVIAVFAGQKPTGGYGIKIEKITDTNNTRVVSIVLTEPGSNCATTESITSPFDMVKVPASALTPVREERVITQDCP